MTVKCEGCGVRNAKYVCQNCGSKVCPSCFNPHLEFCIKCAGSSYSEAGLEYGIGFKIMILGFALAFLGILITIILAILTGVGDLSFVILLLPIPIGVVAGPYGGILLILALILTVIFMAILILISRKRLKSFISKEMPEGV